MYNIYSNKLNNYINDNDNQLITTNNNNHNHIFETLNLNSLLNTESNEKINGSNNLKSSSLSDCKNTTTTIYNNTLHIQAR